MARSSLAGPLGVWSLARTGAEAAVEDCVPTAGEISLKAWSMEASGAVSARACGPAAGVAVPAAMARRFPLCVASAFARAF